MKRGDKRKLPREQEATSMLSAQCCKAPKCCAWVHGCVAGPVLAAESGYKH